MKQRDPFFNPKNGYAESIIYLFESKKEYAKRHDLLFDIKNGHAKCINHLFESKNDHAKWHIGAFCRGVLHTPS